MSRLTLIIDAWECDHDRVANRHFNPLWSRIGLIPEPYRSPSPSRAIAFLEEDLLSRDDSAFTGRSPLYARMVAEVPRALYLNFLVSKSCVAALAPGVFSPLDLPGDHESTLFTILLFTLEHARPVCAPQIFGAFSPRIMQSNWRFYGHIKGLAVQHRPGVLFIHTVTTSLLLSLFGRRLARCFPLRRAAQMNVEVRDECVSAVIDPGKGTAPALVFEGERMQSAPAQPIFREQFPSYDTYARWIIDQRLSLVIWPREHVIQDMHLDFQKASITPLRCLQCRVSAVADFLPEKAEPFDCFMAERLPVFLDSISAMML